MLVKKNRPKVFEDIPVAFVCKRGMYICNNGKNPLIVENFSKLGKFRIWHWNGTRWTKSDYIVKGKFIVSDESQIAITARTYEQLCYLKTIM